MIPHNKPCLGPEEQFAAQRVLGSGWVAQGPEVAAFENEFCAWMGIPSGHAVAVSSGTAALFLALWALGAKDKKVTFPVYACSALRHAVALAGAKEVLVDTAPDSPNVDPEIVEATRSAIAIVPHMYGIPVDLRRYEKMTWIEDCAQAVGAAVGPTRAGCQAPIGIFSFYATKLLTSGGQGGMVIAKDKALIDQIRDYREFDCRRDQKHRFNFQMTDLQAAIGRAQLAKLHSFLEKRQEIFKRYRQAGAELLEAGPDTLPVRYRAVLKTGDAKNFLRHLESEGIKAIVPLEDWEILGEAERFPNALQLSRRTVSVPLYPALEEEQIEKIAQVLRRCR